MSFIECSLALTELVIKYNKYKDFFSVLNGTRKYYYDSNLMNNLVYHSLSKIPRNQWPPHQLVAPFLLADRQHVSLDDLEKFVKKLAYLTPNLEQSRFVF